MITVSLPQYTRGAAMERDTTSSFDEIGAIFTYPIPASIDARHFTWGAELGSSVDLTSNNLTTFDVYLNLGYKSNLFPLLGASVGIQRAIGTGNTFVPIYFIMRTTFRNRPSRFFMQLKAGYSFNTIESTKALGGFSMSAGVGMVLVKSKKIATQLFLAYGLYHLNMRYLADVSINQSTLSFAQLGIGINF